MEFSICSRSEPAASWLSIQTRDSSAGPRACALWATPQERTPSWAGQPRGCTALPPVTGSKQLVEVLSPLTEGALHTAVQIAYARLTSAGDCWSRRPPRTATDAHGRPTRRTERVR